MSESIGKYWISGKGQINPPTEKTSALQRQTGGSHYKQLAIQPVEFSHLNGLGLIEGCVVKYVTRWRTKGGVEDLEKAKHFLELLIELENGK